MKVSELIGPALDWAVAKCDGRKIGFNCGGGLEVRGRTEDGKELPEQWDLWMPWHPSTDWAQGGPIIDLLIRRGLRIHESKCRYTTDATSVAVDVNGHYSTNGPTVLVATMRCYVASKSGNEIEIPKELM